MSRIYSKDCKREACGRAFTTTRANVVYCSNRCTELDRRFPRATASTTSKSLDSKKPVAEAVHVEKLTWAKIRARVVNHFRAGSRSIVAVEKLRKNSENQGAMRASDGGMPAIS